LVVNDCGQNLATPSEKVKRAGVPPSFSGRFHESGNCQRTRHKKRRNEIERFALFKKSHPHRNGRLGIEEGRPVGGTHGGKGP